MKRTISITLALLACVLCRAQLIKEYSQNQAYHLWSDGPLDITDFNLKDVLTDARPSAFLPDFLWITDKETRKAGTLEYEFITGTSALDRRTSYVLKDSVSDRLMLYSKVIFDNDELYLRRYLNHMNFPSRSDYMPVGDAMAYFENMMLEARDAIIWETHYGTDSETLLRYSRYLERELSETPVLDGPTECPRRFYVNLSPLVSYLVSDVPAQLEPRRIPSVGIEVSLTYGRLTCGLDGYLNDPYWRAAQPMTIQETTVDVGNTVGLGSTLLFTSYRLLDIGRLSMGPVVGIGFNRMSCTKEKKSFEETSRSWNAGAQIQFLRHHFHSFLEDGKPVCNRNYVTLRATYSNYKGLPVDGFGGITISLIWDLLKLQY